MFKGSGPFIQSGWAVADIDEAVDAWLAKGAGPFFVKRDVRDIPAVYRGSPTQVDLDIAWGQLGGLQIELVAQRSHGPSCYRDTFPDGFPTGGGGFHHLAMMNPDFDLAYSSCIAEAFTPAHSGALDGTRVCYFDTRNRFGFMLEITEATPAILEFYEHIKVSAEGWDGSDPTRTV